MRLIVFCFVLGTALAFGRYVRPKSQTGLQCKDEDGNDVDWYVVYKIPEMYHSTKKLLDGTGYMFITSKTVNKGWTVSTKTMEDDANIMAKTIANMYKSSNEEMWLVYNDEPPKNEPRIPEYVESTNSEYGHTKGVVGANSEGGFWLIHSIPHFPSLESYVYPRTALRYGQSALCISLPASELDKVGVAFKYNEPNFAKAKIGDLLGAMYPNLKEAAGGEKIKTAPWYYEYSLTSKGGVRFTGYAKGKSFGKDLYEWVASSLNTCLYVETWMNEPNPLPASCSLKWKVLNIRRISYQAAGVDFNSHKDHSKWAISGFSKNPFICSGDINRALPQEKRGGGTLCLRNEYLWSAYNQLIKDKDSCDNSV